MSLEAKTIQSISDEVIAQLESSLSESFPLLPVAFTRVLAKVMAGLWVLLFKYCGFIFLQLFVAHATYDEVSVNGKRIRPLLEWGRLFGVSDPSGATNAMHTITVTVLDQTGYLPLGARLVHSSGVSYQTLTSPALDSETIQVDVVAIDGADGTGSGSAGTRNTGDSLSFANTPANVLQTAEVTDTVTSGEDSEGVESYRRRIVQHIRRRKQGGAYADYQQWGQEPDGIVAVYPYTGDTPGTIEVYVEATAASSGSEDGVPLSGQLEAVKASIDADVSGLATRRPVNAPCLYLPITRTAVDVAVSGFTAEDPATVQAAVSEALDEHLRSLEHYILGLSTLPRRDRVERAAIAGLVSETVNAYGGSMVDVTISIASQTILSRSLTKGEKAKLGTVTFLESS